MSAARPPETHAVVVNDAGQYSVWPVERAVPGGWREVGFRGDRDGCLDHVEAVWQGPRPALPDPA
ncbi:MbtH family protein [Streptomyces noursei]|uniref:MbtH family protein n=1 Tax=Streptomyces noursei TaxID=1971 RepID=UPI001F3EC0FB|nr:MbtH family protein [Streptomyces noursei]MCE4942080.1 MbtH family protein [Streptomyces noursei]